MHWLFVAQCHQHARHGVCPIRPGFCCWQPSHVEWDPPLLHLLFLKRCRQPPDIVHRFPRHDFCYYHPHDL
jgi:hypothetical protein